MDSMLMSEKVMEDYGLRLKVSMLQTEIKMNEKRWKQDARECIRKYGEKFK